MRWRRMAAAGDSTTGNLRESIRLRGLSGRRQPAIIQAADGAGQRAASNGDLFERRRGVVVVAINPCAANGRIPGTP